MAAAAGSGGRTWFSRAFGFLEQEEPAGYRVNQAGFAMDGDTLVALKYGAGAGKRMHVGSFETPTLHELEARLAAAAAAAAAAVESAGVSVLAAAAAGINGHVQLVADVPVVKPAPDGPRPPMSQPQLVQSEVRGNVRNLHADPANAGAVFMVASQFNCLEMVGPGVTPEHGITRYMSDQTQGPACALACPAGTVFRNYLVHGTGQQGKNQLNNLCDVEALLPKPFWKMRNGYCLPLAATSMAELGALLTGSAQLYESVLRAVRVGVHWDTQVGEAAASDPSSHRVCQVFCSALPVLYCHVTKNRADWTTFATLVLIAAYRAVLAVGAMLSQQRGTRVTVFLTRIGLGAFGNNVAWIQQAIDTACAAYTQYPLDVVMVKFK